MEETVPAVGTGAGRTGSAVSVEGVDGSDGPLALAHCGKNGIHWQMTSARRELP